MRLPDQYLNLKMENFTKIYSKVMNFKLAKFFHTIVKLLQIKNA